jgi:hypothetical protein
MTNPYKRFGVTIYTPADEIKKIFREKAKTLHPDLRPDKERATIEFQQFEEDYRYILGRAPKTKTEGGQSRSSAGDTRSYNNMVDDDKYHRDSATVIYRTKVLQEMDHPEHMVPILGAVVEISPEFAASGGIIKLNMSSPAMPTMSMQYSVQVPPNSKSRDIIDVNDAIKIKLWINKGLGRESV